MKRFALMSLGLLLVVGAAFAGGAQQSGLDIGIAMPETHVERWQMDGAALLEGAQAAGFNAEVAFGDADQSRQNQQIQDFITKGARLLIIGNINEGVNSVVREAAEEGIIIIAYDRLITGTDAYDYYLTFDNFQVGVFQGRAIEEALDLPNVTASNPKIITLFAGSPTDNNANVFFDGAMSVLRPYVQSGALQIVGPAPLSSADPQFSRIGTENWRADIAKARMENLLSADARDVVLDAVLAPNDTLARAIIEALSADAKYDTVDTLPVVTGQDGEVASIQAIRDGRQYMTVFKDTRDLAAAAIQLAQALLEGEAAPRIDGARLDTESYNTGLKIVNSYLLQPVNVTSDNYVEIMIDSGYYTAEEIQ